MPRDKWHGEGQLDMVDIDGDGDIDLIHSTDWTYDSAGKIVGGGVAVAHVELTHPFGVLQTRMRSADFVMHRGGRNVSHAEHAHRPAGEAAEAGCVDHEHGA